MSLKNFKNISFSLKFLGIKKCISGLGIFFAAAIAIDKLISSFTNIFSVFLVSDAWRESRSRAVVTV